MRTIRCSAAEMSAAGSNRVKVVHRKFMSLRVARAASSVSTTSGQPRRPGPWPGAPPRRSPPDTAAPATTRQPPQKTRTSATPAGTAPAVNCARQVAHRIAQAHPHALRALVHRGPGVVQRVHRQVREHVEVGLDARPRQDVLERRLEVAHVHGAVGHQQELRQRQLALAEDAERARHRLARVALLHDGRGQRVVAGLAVGPQRLDRRHHHREERRQQLLQQVADEEVLLARLADHRGRDRSRRPGARSP